MSNSSSANYINSDVKRNEKSPAFQFYPADFLADENVVMMSNTGIGCYIKLMCFCWREGSIPSDIGKLARLCGESGLDFSLIWEELKDCFEVMAGDTSRLMHPRLMREKEKQEQRKQVRSASGKVGASARWNKVAEAGELSLLTGAKPAAPNKPAQPTFELLGDQPPAGPVVVTAKNGIAMTITPIEVDGVPSDVVTVHVPEAAMRSLVAKFAGVNVPQQIERFEGWLTRTPARRPKSNPSAALNNWLTNQLKFIGRNVASERAAQERGGVEVEVPPHVQMFVDEFNKRTKGKLQEVQKIIPSRISSVNSALARHDLAWWQNLFDLTQKQDMPNFTGFDWILREENTVKVLELTYIKHKPNASQGKHIEGKFASVKPGELRSTNL